MSSPDPVIEQLPPPKSFLGIEGDPTMWGLTEADVVSPPWLGTGHPVALPVVTPLSGTLLFAPSHAGSFLLNPVLPEGGWVPCAQLQSPYLYLPRTTGVIPQEPGYRLSPGTSLETLRHDILAAMRAGTMLKIGVSIGPSIGTVVLHGGRLPIVVLVEAELARTTEAPAG